MWETMTLEAKLKDVMRSVLETLARIAIGERVRIVPEHKVKRLDELERRERLQKAEAAGDFEYLQAELDKSQLTEADLDRLEKGATPISEWPDEDLDDCFTPTPDAQRDRTPKRLSL
jgi:hypothetical protein